jgi:hypothetical protein
LAVADASKEVDSSGDLGGRGRGGDAVGDEHGHVASRAGVADRLAQDTYAEDELVPVEQRDVGLSVPASTLESSAAAMRAARRGRLNGGDPIRAIGAWDLTTAVDT